MDYKTTISTINNLNHQLQTKTLTRKETQTLITTRETLWSNYINQKG